MQKYIKIQFLQYRKHTVFIRKTTRLILFKEIVTLSCEATLRQGLTIQTCIWVVVGSKIVPDIG